MDKSIIEAIMKAKLWFKANVVGFSNNLKPKITAGKITGIPCIRVYVARKLPRECLSSRDIIPPFIQYRGKAIPTDVVEVGHVEALASKTSRVRPVKLGVSISHWNVTAGSLGIMVKYGNEAFYASNAHVLAPDPFIDPDNIIEKRIIQPGSYHGGRTDANIVGYYVWHRKLLDTGVGCPASSAICSILNSLSKLLNRKTRFYYTTLNTNYIDFAVYEPIVEHVNTTADGSLTTEPFIGLLFAGSNAVGVICKSRYIEAEGFIPVTGESGETCIAEVSDGDTVAGSSFWCNYTTTVLDSSANITVGYGTKTAYFSDVILVNNDGTIKGGWSGSGWRLISSNNKGTVIRNG